jgi:hypothetical protein
VGEILACHAPVHKRRSIFGRVLDTRAASLSLSLSLKSENLEIRARGDATVCVALRLRTPWALPLLHQDSPLRARRGEQTLRRQTMYGLRVSIPRCSLCVPSVPIKTCWTCVRTHARAGNASMTPWFHDSPHVSPMPTFLIDRAPALIITSHAPPSRSSLEVLELAARVFREPYGTALDPSWPSWSSWPSASS